MSRIIKLNHITKIEGHASLNLSIKDGKVKVCELQATEGSRYFEGLLKGNDYYEASELSSRICGICSCAHTVTSIQAMENALGIKPSKQTVLLRELLTIGERIRSHATHLYFLALPDYVGYESALAMADKYKKEILRALRIIKLGNSIVKVVGGRDLHPVSLTVGGFLKIPLEEQLAGLKKELSLVKDDAAQTGRLFAKLKYPNFINKTESSSLAQNSEFATLYGDIKSESRAFMQKQYKKYFKEYHEEYATSNFVVKEGKSYRVGALARLNNNHKLLSSNAKKIISSSRISFPNYNPFINNFAQAVEVVHFVDRAVQIINSLNLKKEPIKKARLRPCHGVAAIEVPRGTLFHEYELDENGIITYANIITPTAQNLRNIQDDIRAFLPQIMNLPEKKLILEIEKLIRAYDPCFSCSTHFLKVNFV
ncbi:Ni/Fe hydrogenase subunit alpha [Candidatus Woesearchaeota archaeon]|nr:Ni/Fe hydrogenase subunit alpha [Candidatus Woesearchaeota archaeon]|tara:strand:+ start:4574 stop:5848 length:1275 start_codon:yes stop_codon:yes gene_type:complete